MDDGASLWLSSMEQWNDGTNATCNDSKRIVPFLAGKHDFKANLGGKWDFSRGMAVRDTLPIPNCDPHGDSNYELTHHLYLPLFRAILTKKVHTRRVD